MSGSLAIHGTSLTGSLSGNAVKCQLHATQPGSLPPPGMYQIQVPHHDALFGAVVLMHKAGIIKSPSVAPTVGKFAPGAGDLVAHKMGPAAGRGQTANKKNWSPVEKVQIQHPKYGRSPDDKFGQPVLDPTYVLASSAIPGRNCLVVTTGFSDLIAGLMTSGGAVLEVQGR